MPLDAAFSQEACELAELHQLEIMPATDEPEKIQISQFDQVVVFSLEQVENVCRLIKRTADEVQAGDRTVYEERGIRSTWPPAR